MSTGGSLPRIVTWVLGRCLRDVAGRESLIGDVEERYARLGPGRRLQRIGWLVAECSAAVLHDNWDHIRAGHGGEGRMDDVRQDLQFAVRGLFRRPGFSLLVIVTLALAIGANSAAFSVLKGVLFEPLPLGDAEHIVLVDQRNDEGFTSSVSFPNYRDWKERSRTLESVAVILPGSSPLATDEGGLVVETAWVHGGFFETLRVEAALGRTLTAAESEPGGEAVAVLSHGLWRAAFGADTSVVGSTIVLGGAPFTVVGVMPADFPLFAESDVYLPLGQIVDRVAWNDRGTGGGARVVARLASGYTLEDARTELTDVVAGLRAEFGEDAYWANLVPLRDWYLGDAGRQALLMMAAVVLMLIVACVNIANLLAVRAETRRAELAVRAALGAGRGRIHRQLLTESAMFGMVGGALGFGVARLGVDVLRSVLSDTLPPGAAARVTLDGTVLLFTAAAALGTALAAGLVPALRAARSGLADALRSGSGGLRPAGRVGGALVGTEVAITMVLLVCAGLVVESLRNLQQVDRGYDGRDVVTLRVSLAGAEGYGSRESWADFHERLRERVSTLPGVRLVATSNHFPLSGNSWEMLYRDESTQADERGASVLLTMVSPEYFDTYGVEIIEGRGFTEADRWGDENVAIVDETLAAARWPDESAIGKRVTFEQLPNEEGEYVIELWRRVVGVARHVRHYELATPSRIQVYTPLSQSAAWGFASYLSVRAADDARALVPGVRAALAELEPRAALHRIRTIEDVLDRELGTHRAIGELLGVFAALTLLLGAVGIYSVVSYAASLRVREVGVRKALGGEPRRMTWLIVQGSLRHVIPGLIVGAALAVGASRLLGALLYEVSPAEPSVLAAAGLGLLLAAMLSAWVPARKAARVHPTEALRNE